MLIYNVLTNGDVTVFSGRRLGIIKKLPDGWLYYPSGKKKYANSIDKRKTLDEVKTLLEIPQTIFTGG